MPDGNPIDQTQETDANGNPIDQIAETDAEGNPIDQTAETDANGNPISQTQETDANGNPVTTNPVNKKRNLGAEDVWKNPCVLFLWKKCHFKRKEPKENGENFCD